VRHCSTKRLSANSAAVYGTEGHRFESCRARLVTRGEDHHATGVRVRELPITLDKLLAQ
jgi:hypothetical protein